MYSIVKEEAAADGYMIAGEKGAERKRLMNLRYRKGALETIP